MSWKRWIYLRPDLRGNSAGPWACKSGFRWMQNVMFTSKQKQWQHLWNRNRATIVFKNLLPHHLLKTWKYPMPAGIPIAIFKILYWGRGHIPDTVLRVLSWLQLAEVVTLVSLWNDSCYTQNHFGTRENKNVFYKKILNCTAWQRILLMKDRTIWFSYKNGMLQLF